MTDLFELGYITKPRPRPIKECSYIQTLSELAKWIEKEQKRHESIHLISKELVEAIHSIKAKSFDPLVELQSDRKVELKEEELRRPIRVSRFEEDEEEIAERRFMDLLYPRREQIGHGKEGQQEEEQPGATATVAKKRHQPPGYNSEDQEEEEEVRPGAAKAEAAAAKPQ